MNCERTTVSLLFATTMVVAGGGVRISVCEAGLDVSTTVEKSLVKHLTLVAS